MTLDYTKLVYILKLQFLLKLLGELLANALTKLQVTREKKILQIIWIENNSGVTHLTICIDPTLSTLELQTSWNRACFAVRADAEPLTDEHI